MRWQRLKIQLRGGFQANCATRKNRNQQYYESGIQGHSCLVVRMLTEPFLMRLQTRAG
jgi:hypothetical protein